MKKKHELYTFTMTPRQNITGERLILLQSHMFFTTGKINIYLFIETYLYRVDIISSQAIFHMCPVVILLYENKHSII